MNPSLTPKGVSIKSNSDIFTGKWEQMKGKVKAKWGKLSDDELDRAEGNSEQLEGLLQEH
jgi:uncharacterized protein YjbJ (UPF0337 family)